MSSIAVVAPAAGQRVSGVVDVRVRVVGAVSAAGVSIAIGPPEFGTRRMRAVGGGEHVYRWDTRRKLVDESLEAPADAVHWISASAQVDGTATTSEQVSVVTANRAAAVRSASAVRGGWRPELAWAADYSSPQRWRASQAAVVGARYAELVPDPVLGEARTVVRASVPDSAASDADQPNDRTVRFQSSSPRVIVEGDELCVGFAFLLPDDFPDVYPEDDPLNPRGPRGSGYIALFQVYGPPYEQGAPFVLHAERRLIDDPLGEVVVRGNELNPGDPAPLVSLPYRRGAWTDVVFRLRASSSVELGWLEVHVNQGESDAVRPLTWQGQQRIPRTLLRPGSQAFRTDMQVYRVKGCFDEVTVLHTGHRVARTVAEADPGSYRSGS